MLNFFFSRFFFLSFSYGASSQALSSGVSEKAAMSRKLQVQAREEWRVGDLEKSIETLRRARELTPLDKNISRILKIKQIQKKIADHALKKAEMSIKQKKYLQARESLKKAGYVSTVYPRYVTTENRLAEAEKAEKIHREMRAKKFK